MSASLPSGHMLCRCSRWNGPYRKALNTLYNRDFTYVSKNRLRLRHFSTTPSLHSTEDKKTTASFRRQNVLFMGTDDFAMRVLSGLHSDLQSNTSSPIAHLEVVCPPDRPFGRKKIPKGAAVKNYAVQHDLTVHHIPAEGIKHWTVPKVKSTKSTEHTPFDIGVVVSFGYFIPGRIIDAFQLMVNIHPSLLPRHRGASPIQYTILSGDSEAGVSLIELSKKSFDSGNIVSQKQFAVQDSDTFQTLSDRLVPLSTEMLLTTISSVANGEEIQSKPQSSYGREITHAPKVDSTTSRIDWSKHTCADIDRIQRALAHKTPLYSTWNGKEIKLLDMVNHQKDSLTLDMPAADQVQDDRRKRDSQNNMEVPNKAETDLDAAKENVRAALLLPGTPRYDVDSQILYIRCADGWVGFQTVQTATKKPSTSAAFANGYNLRATGLSPEKLRFV